MRISSVCRPSVKLFLLAVFSYIVLIKTYGYLKASLQHSSTTLGSRYRVIYDKIWLLSNASETKRFLYRAYYDDRKRGGNSSHIRILALSTARTEPALFCRVSFEDGTFSVINAKTSSSGRGHDINNVFYAQVFYTCTLISHSMPVSVMIIEKRSENPTEHLPVFVPSKKQEHEFGICVCITYWNMNADWLFEWFEFMKLLGVTEVNIYDGGMNNSTAAVMKYYERQGMVNLQRLPTPVMGPDDINTHTVTVPASLNDCFWRNMHRYKYALVIDLDEIIVPKLQMNYHDMLSYIDRELKLSGPAASYTARNAYFGLDISGDESQPAGFTTLRQVYRHAPSGYLMMPKSFIDPQRCLLIFNHYCWIQFDQRPDPWTVDINTTVALSHHYKNVKILGPQNLYHENSTHRFKHRLVKNVRKQKDLFGKSSLVVTHKKT